MATIEAAYQEVLDAIECDVEGPERCVLLTHTVRDAMQATLEAVLKAQRDGAMSLGPIRASIAKLGNEER